MVKLIYFTISVIVCFLIHYACADYGQQSKIVFPNQPQAQRLWDDKVILGNSTYIQHPVSLGTFTNCDDIELAKIFNDQFNFLVNYTVDSNNYEDPAVRVVTGAAYRGAEAQRTIENKILSAEGCVTACVTEKDFLCRECDFFEKDGGKCALYNTTGYIFEQASETSHPLYVGDNSASVHYTIYKEEENPTICNVTDGEYAHSSFALGWKGMETGWYTLAHYMFDEAIRIDPEFHLAYVGKSLSNDYMGYGMSDENGVSYKDHMNNILNSADFNVRLSLQEQLLVKALSTFQNAPDMDEGLDNMIQVFTDSTVYIDSILEVVEGNAYLLRQHTYQILNQLAKDENVYALHLLTHNLNPYKNGKKLITSESQKAATAAVYDYQKLGIEGAWQITADCTDINEYYSRWKPGRLLLENQATFLLRNTDPNDPEELLGEDSDNLIVHGLGVTYSTNSLQRFNIYERLHFFELQLALFNVAMERLKKSILQTKEEVWEMIRFRMTANAYFSSYGYIYDDYASNILIFEEDWKRPINESTNDLAIASRAYYWASAALQKLYRNEPVSDIKVALGHAKEALSKQNENYETLLDLYEEVVMGTEHLLGLRYGDARRSAEKAGDLQEKLVGADFRLPGVEDSNEFRMLIPLGYQFEADTLNTLFEDESATAEFKESPITENDVIDAYERGVNTPPLETSRLLYGYGSSLFRRDKDNPRREGDPLPSYVIAFETLEITWADSEVPGSFAALEKVDTSIQHYYGLEISGCGTNFQIVSKGDGQLCWGGYVIIGVACGLFVIILIIIGILCLRKKAKAPTKDKEKDRAFIFSGPNLSRQESFGSSSRIGLDTLNKDASNATPYASQTLSIQRPFHDIDYTQRSNTIGGVGQTGDFEAHSAH